MARSARAGRGFDNDSEDKLRSEVQCPEGATRFVAPDESDGGENAGEKDADLHEVGGRHDDSLVDPDGAAEHVGPGDQRKVGHERAQAGELRLTDNVAQDGRCAGARLGADLHLPLCIPVFGRTQVRRLGRGDHRDGRRRVSEQKNIQREQPWRKGN